MPAIPTAPAALPLAPTDHFNPVTDPMHPLHPIAARHIGAAFGHILTGNHEQARQHAHAALDHVFAPLIGAIGGPSNGTPATPKHKPAARGKKAKKR